MANHKNFLMMNTLLCPEHRHPPRTHKHVEDVKQAHKLLLQKLKMTEQDWAEFVFDYGIMFANFATHNQPECFDKITKEKKYLFWEFWKAQVLWHDMVLMNKKHTFRYSQEMEYLATKYSLICSYLDYVKTMIRQSLRS